MNSCVQCHLSIPEEDYQYVLSNLGFEITTVLDLDHINALNYEECFLCNHCFEEACLNMENQRALSEREVNMNRCIWCERSLNGQHIHSLPDGPEASYIMIQIAPRLISADSRVCYRCWLRARRAVQPAVEMEAPIPNPGPAHVVMTPLQNYRRSGNSQSHCFVHGCGNMERINVPHYLRVLLLKEYKFYIMPNARVCNNHLIVYNWDDILNDNFHLYINTFSSREIEEMLQILSNFQFEEKLDFENIESMDDNTCHHYTGLSKNNFQWIINNVPQLKERFRKYNTALAVYLIKLRSAEPNSRLALKFYLSECHVGRILTKVRTCLKEGFVPNYLGINNVNRENILSRNLMIPEGLFGNQNEGGRSVIVIADGTYIYLQKSSNYFFQKNSYSLHKYRNLVKPFLIVASDGYIIDIFGPYAATVSDADITKLLFANENSELRQFFQENDVFILDKGFRDAVPLLRSFNYKVYMPETKEANERQLPTDKANRSRYVTLCRWVVEVVNGRFKRDFKIFRSEFFNPSATHLMDDFKIAGALINRFHPLITNRTDAHLILNRALERMNLNNDLADYIDEYNINRRHALFINIDDVRNGLRQFPRMTMDDLILFALGIYQIKQARSYYGEHIRERGSFSVEISRTLEAIALPGNVLNHEIVLLRGRIKSRYRGNTTYYTYILLAMNNNTWKEIISQYCCSCLVGRRTVGCCAHVMTIVWYLGWARHQQNITAPASFLDDILIREDLENEGENF